MEADVDIADIQVDMPVSENLVQAKMKMLAKDGLIQPLAIWKQGMLVIDGFHRLEAAKRLGWKTIRCSIIDVTEEQFWTSRIDSAKQHHEVEKPRLISWIQKCWNMSEFSDDERLAECLWRIRKQVHSTYDLWKSTRSHLTLSARDMEIVSWFDQHAERWSMTVIDVLDAVLEDTTQRRRDYETIDIAAKKDLSLPELVQLSTELGHREVGFRREHIEPPAIARFIDSGMPHGSIQRFNDAVRSDRDRDEQQKIQVEAARREREELELASTIKGIALLISGLQDEFERRILNLQRWMTENERGLSASPDGRETIERHMAVLADLSSKFWPENTSADAVRQRLQDDAVRRLSISRRLQDATVYHGDGTAI